MEIEHIILIVLGVLAICWLILLACFVIACVCFFKTFYSPKSRKKMKNKVVDKASDIFIKNIDKLHAWRDEVASYPYEDVYITSFDGLKLHGKYYKVHENAPIEIFFHGYRGSADRDMNGGVLRALTHGRNALAVDQRGGGASEGTVITFGVNESRDCEKWIDYVISREANVKIILSGVSMGAATVLIASGRDLPKNVVGIVADCGYTSQKEMIMDTMYRMHLPAKLFYPFAILGGQLFGHFNIDEVTPFEMMPKSKIPTIFYHGDNDAFVPHEMSKKKYDACASTNKRLVTIEGAGHAAAFLVNQEMYMKELEAFLAPLVK